MSYYPYQPGGTLLRPVKTISRSKDELKGYVIYIYFYIHTHIRIYIYITHLIEKRCNLVTAKKNILRSLVGCLPQTGSTLTDF